MKKSAKHHGHASASPSADAIGARLRLEIKKSGLSSGEVAKRAEVKTSFLYDIISGKSLNPSTIKLARVAEALGISLGFLVGGTNETSAAATKKMADGEYVTIPRISVDTLNANTIVSQEHAGERYCFRKSWIKEQLDVAVGDLRLLTVRGDSMEPTLYHNDMILVDTTKKLPSPPGIFVLFDGAGLVAKRVEYATRNEQARIRIIPDNPQYSSYERSVAETLIIGRVVWFAREI